MNAKQKSGCPGLRFVGETAMKLYDAKQKLREAQERYLNAKATKATGPMAYDVYVKVTKALKNPEQVDRRAIIDVIITGMANAYKKGCLDEI